MACDNSAILTLFYYIKIVEKIIFIGAPILLLVLGTVDLGRAVINSKPDALKIAFNNLIKRIVITIIILLLPTIVSFVVSMGPIDTNNVDCFAKATKENIEDFEKIEKVEKETTALEIPTPIISDVNKRLVEISSSQIGIKSQPAGTYCNKYNQWYYNKNKCSSNYHWCSAFVSWVANEAGVLDVDYPRTPYCPTAVSWYKRNSRWQTSNYIPKAGDIIFFDWNFDKKSDHVGIVEYVENGRVHTIEGNLNNSVSRANRVIDGTILGYGIIN